MTLTRRHAAVLLLIAAWNVLSYANFARNLYDAHASGEDRPTAYWVAHLVLIVVNLVVAVVLARWGLRAWRTPATPDATGATNPTDTTAQREQEPAGLDA